MNECIARPAAAALATAAVLLGAGAAHAGTITADDPLESTVAIIGNTTPSSIGYSFDVPGPGTLTVSLSDDVWPSRLADFSFKAVQGKDTVFSLDMNPGDSGLVSRSGTFDVAGAGSFFGYVTGLATGSLDLGLYSLDISFQPAEPVPLPASVWMLLVGFAAAAGALRYRVALSCDAGAAAPTR